MSHKQRRRYSDKISWFRTLLLIGVSLVLLFCIFTAYRQIDAQDNSHSPSGTNEPIGNLLLVKSNPNLCGEILDYDYFHVNFNAEAHIPNWVCWELTAAETSGEEERGNFQTDERVKGCANSKDYTKSGYDRGHMVPAADMKWSDDAMNSCFYMTNICPQSHSLNSGSWKKLEEKCRLWAQVDSAIVIVCGPIFEPKPDEFIGQNQVAVPKAFFKVICSPYSEPPRGIGFIMPNGKVAGGLQKAAVSIDEVEAASGHDFFYELPDSIENAIESECRFHYWSTLKPQ